MTTGRDQLFTVCFRRHILHCVGICIYLYLPLPPCALSLIAFK